MIIISVGSLLGIFLVIVGRESLFEIPAKSAVKGHLGVTVDVIAPICAVVINLAVGKVGNILESGGRVVGSASVEVYFGAVVKGCTSECVFVSFLYQARPELPRRCYGII